MRSNKHIYKKKDKISLTNLDNISSKRYGDLSLGNLYTCDYSTIATNSNIFNNKTPNLDRINTPISPTKNTYNTIEENSGDIFYLSKINLEHDIYLSSLKKKLAIIKEERKKSEANVMNAKKKIIELQKEEQKSLSQLENTKKYITKIIENRKKYTNKNFDIKITKINNIFQTNKGPNNRLYHSGNLNCKTWFAHKKNKPVIKPQLASHINCQSGLENNTINNSYLIYNKLKPSLNASKHNTIESIQKSNLSHKKIYSRKRIKIKNKFINNLKDDTYTNTNTNYSVNNNINEINNITSVNNYINQKNNNKILRESLILRLKKNEIEKKKIEKQIKEIEMEENKLYNNFYGNLEFYNSAKTLD